MDNTQILKLFEAHAINMEAIELQLRSMNTPLVDCAIKHIEIARVYLDLECCCLKRVIEDKV